MESAAPDRRSLKTRAALLAAFRDLLLERGYEALQVGEVSDKADVGRSTLYEHFNSKAALLRASLAAPFGQLADLVLPAAAPRPIIPSLQHFRDHQQMVRMLLGWPTRPILSQTLTALIAERLPQGQDITARLIADAQLALLDMWILGRPACTIETAAGILQRSSAALADAGLLAPAPELASDPGEEAQQDGPRQQPGGSRDGGSSAQGQAGAELT